MSFYLVYSELCHQPHNLFLEYFYRIQKMIAIGTANLLSVSID